MGERLERFPQEHPGLSDEELEKLSARDETHRALVELLKSQLPVLYSMLRQEGASTDLENVCNTAASELHAVLRHAGFDSVILEGDLQRAPHDWLTHRVNLVKLPKEWVVIDLTVRQLPWLKERSWLLEKIPPDKNSLKKFLKDTYHWWVGKEDK